MSRAYASGSFPVAQNETPVFEICRAGPLISRCETQLAKHRRVAHQGADRS
jgi:hypothetical protein